MGDAPNKQSQVSAALEMLEVQVKRADELNARESKLLDAVVRSEPMVVDKDRAAVTTVALANRIEGIAAEYRRINDQRLHLLSCVEL